MIPDNISDREDYIYDQVIAGNFEGKWTELNYTAAGKQVKLLVMEDALKVDDVRVNVSATLAQKLADVFDASLPTAQIADAIYGNAVRRAQPRPMSITTSTVAMKSHSDSVEKQIGGSSGLASTVGKHWVLDSQLETKPGSACNYGWHFTGQSFQGIRGSLSATILCGTNVRVIQPNATAHDPHHVDYSQICQLVSQRCWIDGAEMRLSDALTRRALVAEAVDAAETGVVGVGITGAFAPSSKVRVATGAWALWEVGEGGVSIRRLLMPLAKGGAAEVLTSSSQVNIDYFPIQ